MYFLSPKNTKKHYKISTMTNDKLGKIVCNANKGLREPTNG